jgi:hypothetical protein
MGFIENVKPDLVIIDSLGSFAEDESGGEAMKSVLGFLLRAVYEIYWRPGCTGSWNRRVTAQRTP